MSSPLYSHAIKKVLSPAERRVFNRLTTPQKIQDFLDALPINFGETLFSPRRVLREKKAHCFEAALLAAAAFAYHGRPPLLLDFQTIENDEDHVLALFKEHGLWGAISKTNHSIIRFRDPVYRSVRELSMSYFHEYLMWDGRKSLRSFSTRPFNMRRFKPAEWIIAEEDLTGIEGALDWAPHSPALPKQALKSLRRASPIELKAMKLTEWKKKR